MHPEVRRGGIRAYTLRRKPKVLNVLLILVVALGCAALAVATVHRPRVAAASAAAAAGLLLVVAALLTGVDGIRWPYPVACVAAAVVTFAWALAVGIGDADRRERAEIEAERARARAERTGDLHPDSSRSVRHQIALDNIYGPDHESELAR